MADITNVDKTVMTHNADVYWHYAGDPVQRAQLLGTFTIGTAQKVLLPIPVTADIVLRAVPRGGRGQTFMGGPADATPVTVNVPGLGTGGGTSNYYQQLKVNHGYSYGTVPTPRPVLNLLQSFQIKDDAVFGESDLTTFGVPTGMLNLKTDFNASGQIAVTTATWSGIGSNIVLAATLELQPGQGIYVAGAGVSGSPLITTCTAVSADGKTITLAAGPFGGSAYSIVQADDTAAVQAWLKNPSTGMPNGDLAMPPGYYRLSSSITLPTTSEGFSTIIHGSGWDQSQFVFQHGGDGFIPTAPDLKIDSMVFLDLTVATGTIGDTSGTIDANSKGIGVRMTAPSYTGIYNNFVLQRCRVIGWGRWGLWSDNLEVSWISQCIFRENKSGHVAFVGPDTISPNKQPNANTITDSTFDQAISAGPSDAKRTFSGSMTAGNRTLSGSGFTANDRGKFVIVHGAATGSPTGGDLFTFIDTFTSSTQVTLAHQAQNTVTNTVELFPVNVASILLNRANDTVLDGSTIQGNFADAGSGATNVLSDVNAIKCYNSANCRFIGIHEEDNAGPGGAAIRMENCIAMTIENWGGTSAGPPDFLNAHRSDFALINCHCVSVKNSFFNDRPQFEIDSTSSETQIDDSFIVGYINLWQQDNSWDRLRIGSGVRVYQAADPRTNQVAGNEYSYDSMFGRDLIVNGRFLDGSDHLEGWTTASPTWWSLTTTSQTRGGTFFNVDATAIASSTTPTTILHQSVAIPDTTGPGLFTCAFDWNLDSQNGVETTGYYVEVRLHPSSGIDEVCQFSTRRFSVVQDTWQVGHVRCFLGSGTGRTIDVQVNVTPGANNVIIHFANFRMCAGKHMFGAWERGIHDFGGRMHAPLEYASIATSGTGSTAPPPIGASYMSMVNDAGTLKIGYNGVWTTVASGGGSGAVISGTPFKFAMFNSPAGNNVVDAPVKFEFGEVHCLSVGIWLDRTMSLNSVYGSSQFCELALVGTDDTIYFGPAHDTTAGSTGVAVCIRSGTGTSQKGRLWLDGTNGKLTFNDINTNTYNSAFFLRLGGTSQNGLTIRTVESAYSGQFFFQCMSALDVVQLAIDSNGDLARIRRRDYAWPTTTPINTGTTPNVLGYTGQTTANAPVTLSWIPMTGGSGSIPPGTPNRIVKYDATGSSITNAPAEDAVTEFHIIGVGLRVDNNQVVNTLYASPANYCELATCGTDNIVRFGPALTNTGTSSGGNVLIRSGCGSADQGRLWIGGSTGQLTFNADTSANTGTTNASVFYAKIIGAAVHGLTIQSPSSYSGNFIQCFGSIPQNRFVVDFNGDLTVIRAKSYNWPTAITYPASGAMKVLGYTTASGTPQLQWLDPAAGGGGAVGPGTIGRLAVFTTTSNVGSSNFAEDTANLHVAFNEVPTAGHALLIRPAVNDNGVVVYPKAASTGAPFYYQDSAGGSRFGVNSLGDINFIHNLPYTWPTSAPYPTGGAIKVLGYTTTSGTPALQWLDPTTGSGFANTALSNLVTTSINQSLNFNADASYNIGNGTNRVGAIYLYNGLFIYPRSSTSSSPRACGFIPLVTTAGSNSGECTRFDVYADWNTLQAGDDARFQISSYRTIELHGQRNSSAAPAFTRESTFNANNPAVLILQDSDTEGLWINSPGFAGTKNKIRVRQNSADVFTVNAAGTTTFGALQGRIIRINPGAGVTVDMATQYGIFDCRTIVCDLASGSFKIRLPFISSCDGRSWHIVLRPKSVISSAYYVSLMVQSGDDINEVAMTTSSEWQLNINSNAQRYVVLTADYNAGSSPQWRLAGLNSP